MRVAARRGAWAQGGESLGQGRTWLGQEEVLRMDMLPTAGTLPSSGSAQMWHSPCSLLWFLYLPLKIILCSNSFLLYHIGHFLLCAVYLSIALGFIIPVCPLWLSPASPAQIRCLEWVWESSPRGGCERAWESPFSTWGWWKGVPQGNIILVHLQDERQDKMGTGTFLSLVKFRVLRFIFFMPV